MIVLDIFRVPHVPAHVNNATPDPELDSFLAKIRKPRDPDLRRELEMDYQVKSRRIFVPRQEERPDAPDEEDLVRLDRFDTKIFLEFLNGYCFFTILQAHIANVFPLQCALAVQAQRGGLPSDAQRVNNCEGRNDLMKKKTADPTLLSFTP
ncbi:unnamed protein product [Darwinula stevensoni]|uniref:Uncharacterized protein n=1 Tax=Darwinula stevensoni TaxID=69355 RepID=A0A7R9A8S1_9CRUS|nr:unnamed protein product [Darwinula stevensoni]CAG0896665.1 unnamed protein product [Darwinula stevensoni]